MEHSGVLEFKTQHIFFEGTQFHHRYCYEPFLDPRFLKVGGSLDWLEPAESEGSVYSTEEWSPTFLASGTGFMEDSFSTDQGWGWFWDDSSALHLSCTLFLLLLHQLHLRSSGTGSQRWGPLASVQFSHSVMSNSVTPWTAARQASLSITNSWSLLRLMSIESVMPSNHLIHCHPLLPLSVFPRIRVFSKESTLCIRLPKFWSFSISPSNEYSGLTSFRMD